MCCCLLPYGLCCFTGWKSSQSRSHRTEEEKEGGTWAKGGEKVFSCCALPPLRACVCVCWLTPSIRPSVRPPAREKGKKKKRTEYRAIIRLRERPVDWPNLRSDHQTLNFSFIIRTPILLFKSFISLSPHMQITTQLCCSSVSFGYCIGAYSDTFICEIHRVSILFRPSGAKWS